MADPERPNLPPADGPVFSPGFSPGFSVVFPAFNEAENAGPLIGEIRAALDPLGGEYEIIAVDDGSADATLDALKAAAARPGGPVRVLRHVKRSGQSAALLSGVRAARAPVIVTLDGDGQNDPADIPALYARWREDPDRETLMAVGWRAKRRDVWMKRFSSRFANAVRGALLGDQTPDTGCGLKVFPRAAFMAFPHFNHMHRFMPALMIRGGGRVVSVKVNHRPRTRGVSKYGTLDRLTAGAADLLGVLWLRMRPLNPKAEPSEPEK
ncbi:MAG: glycosyltransferase family 2 protein [Rhodospirillales bacterium]